MYLLISLISLLVACWNGNDSLLFASCLFAIADSIQRRE